MDGKLDKVIEYYSEMVSDLKMIIYDYENDKFFDDVRNTASFKDLVDGYKEELEDKQNLLGWLKELKEMRIKDKESQRPKGKWIKMPLIEAGQTYSHKCSLCGRRILVTDAGLSEFPYCHCGAEMSGGEDDEVSD